MIQIGATIKSIGTVQYSVPPCELWRNVTIAFRMSPEENAELDLRVKLCGYQTRQEYIIESVLHQKVTAVGNPLMLVQFRKQLRGIEDGKITIS